MKSEQERDVGKRHRYNRNVTELGTVGANLALCINNICRLREDNDKIISHLSEHIFGMKEDLNPIIYDVVPITRQPIAWVERGGNDIG